MGWSVTVGLLQSRRMLLVAETIGNSFPKASKGVKIWDFFGELSGDMK